MRKIIKVFDVIEKYVKEFEEAKDELLEKYKDDRKKIDNNIKEIGKKVVNIEVDRESLTFATTCFSQAIENANKENERGGIREIFLGGVFAIRMFTQIVDILEAAEIVEEKKKK